MPMFELSELQLGLLVSGAALIFGVLLLNKIESWRVRKNRPIGTVPLEKKRAEPMLKSNSAAQDTDVLLSAMNGLDADSVQEADFLSRIDVSLAVTSPAMINSIVDSSPTLSAVLAPTELSNV
ncbi:MAG: hypothetical protein IT497_06610, partial [Ottowia sp.]|nr:hypothetical protein [Ottowia sp.]